MLIGIKIKKKSVALLGHNDRWNSFDHKTINVDPGF